LSLRRASSARAVARFAKKSRFCAIAAADAAQRATHKETGG
jgi:hypothetical protein